MPNHHKIKIPSRGQITQQIQNRFELLKENLRSELRKPKHLCETVDIWSNKHRGFFGITAHWIDDKTLMRKSAALSCGHFPSPHTNERIAERLQIVNHDFGISDTVDVHISDNASNFVKALDEFGTDWSCFDSNENENEIPTEDEVEIHDFSSCPLGCHHRCGSHTCNLIAKVDSLFALDDGYYCRMYQAAMKKVESLWSILNQQKANEILSVHLNSSIHRPNATRWNSHFDSLKGVMKKDPEKLKSAMVELKLEPLSSIDREFLNEYLIVMQCLASLLDNLQQTNSYFGILLPSLHATKQNLVDLKSNNSVKYCKPLIEAILDGINTRFENVLDCETDIGRIALIAACSHPFFKLKWIPDPEAIGSAKEKLLRVAKEFQGGSSSQSNFHAATNSSTTSKEISYFYVFLFLLQFILFSLMLFLNFAEKPKEFQYRFVDSDIPQEALAKEKDVLEFLSTPRSSDERDLSQLHLHPVVREIFIKYNTPLTSSGPVERLFGFAGIFFFCSDNEISYLVHFNSYIR